MSSICIATMGMFCSGVGGGGTGKNIGGGVLMVEEKKTKLGIRVISVKSKDITNKSIIEVTSISSGD